MDYAATINRVWSEPGNAQRYRLVPPELIVGQAALETGNFTSAILRENRNLFGLKLPKVRPTLATGENRGHATFSTVEDSVRDYILRQRNFSIPDTSNATEYMRATVASGYATDPDYLRKWAAQVLRVVPVAPVGVAAGLVAALVLLLILEHR